MLTDALTTAAFAGSDGWDAAGLRRTGGYGLPLATGGLRPEFQGSRVPAGSAGVGEQFCVLGRSMPVTAARVRTLGIRPAVAVTGVTPRHTTVLSNFIGTTLGNHSPGRPQS